MKTTEIPAIQQPKAIKYPYLGRISLIEGSFVVLFSKPETGTVIHDPYSVHGVGNYSNTWAEDEFTITNDTYELKN